MKIIVELHPQSLDICFALAHYSGNALASVQFF